MAVARKGTEQLADWNAKALSVAEPSVDMGLAGEGEILGRITRWLVHLAWHHRNVQLRHISPSSQAWSSPLLFRTSLAQNACEHK